jgi:hypothetical protein
MVSELINANPIVYEKKERRARSAPIDCPDEYAVEPIDQPEVFDILSLQLSSFFIFWISIRHSLIISLFWFMYFYYFIEETSHIKVVFLHCGTGFWEL